MRGLALVAMLVAGPVDALSCMRGSPAESYAVAAASEAGYAVALGSFDFAESAMPRGEAAAGSRSVRVPATFEGRALAADGFTQAWRADVTLDVSCLSAWCGSLPPATPVLAFVERTPTGWRLDVAPCPGWVFEAPSPAQIASVEVCHRGGPCPTPAR
ncbi:MAG: hypothetical protein ACU0CO_08375 [Shimia sp.]